MSININFTEADWERLGRDWSAWWAGELDRPMVMIETANMLIFGMQKMTKEFLFDSPMDEVLDFFQQKLETIHYYGDSWPKWFPNFGPGAMAGFLGSKVTFMPKEGTVWYDTDERPPIEELRIEFDPENIWWNRVKNLTKAAVERWGSHVSVGHTDLGGNLDILSSFRTANQLLVELIDSPEEVLRLSKEITSIWLKCYDELHEIIKKAGRGTSGWAEIYSPNGKTYMTQSDFCFMISPDMFEKFVMPDLEACFEHLDNAFYHLDGKGEIVHLDHLLSMENLKGIQWIPGAGQPQPEEWMDLLKRIRDGGKLCQVYVTAQGARKIVKEIGGKGFALYVIPFPVMSEQEAADYLKVLEQEDISRK